MTHSSGGSIPRTPATHGSTGSLSRPRNRKSLYALGALGAALAGSALLNRNATKKAERATPPVGKFIEVDGVRLHYVERGQGRPLVLLHGNGAMIQDWLLSGVFDAAARDYHVIAFDRPGFGYSERPRSTVWSPSAQAALIRKALRQMEIERPIVVGHSWGGLAAVAMALDFPEDVAALVLISGYYFPTARPDVALFSPPAIPVVGDLLRFTVGPIAGRMMSPALIKAMFAPSPVPAAFASWPVEMALRPSQMRAFAADTALMVPEAAILSQRYGELDLPVVIIGGVGDLIAHYDRQAEALHQTVEGSELIRVPDTGHMLHYTVPSKVIEGIDRAALLSEGAAATGAGSDIVPPTAAAAF